MLNIFESLTEEKQRFLFDYFINTWPLSKKGYDMKGSKLIKVIRSFGFLFIGGHTDCNICERRLPFYEIIYRNPYGKKSRSYISFAVCNENHPMHVTVEYVDHGGID